MRNYKFNCTFNCTSLMLLIALAGTALFTNAVFAAEFYMFKDKRGHTQIQDSIPSEYIKSGYKIVNAQGVTLRVIPSEREQRLSLEENQLRQSVSNLAEQKRADDEERDERLFHSFSNVEEIRQIGNKKIMAVQTQIDASVKHVKAFENNLQKLEEQRAAGGEANDGPIEELKESIQQNYAFIDRKRQEQNDIRDEYLHFIQRYEMLSIRR